MRSDTHPSSATFGFFATLGAFAIWGVAPLFWRQLEHVDAPELLAYRIVFAALITAVAVAITDPSWRSVRSLANHRVALTMALSTLLIAINWFVFIWSVQNGRVTEVSLGYYTNPLLNVLLGSIFLKERLRRIQVLAVGIAAFSVVYLTWSLGTIPWVAAVLALSFSFYGYVRKQAPMPALPGLLIETFFCLPFCLGYLIFVLQPSWGTLRGGHVSDALLFLASGLITAVPLFLFSVGARRLRYSTVGMVQYLAPTLQLISAILIFGEPFTQDHAITFGCIWTALAMYTVSALRR